MVKISLKPEKQKMSWTSSLYLSLLKPALNHDALSYCVIFFATCMKRSILHWEPHLVRMGERTIGFLLIGLASGQNLLLHYRYVGPRSRLNRSKGPSPVSILFSCRHMHRRVLVGKQNSRNVIDDVLRWLDPLSRHRTKVISEHEHGNKRNDRYGGKMPAWTEIRSSTKSSKGACV